MTRQRLSKGQRQISGADRDALRQRAVHQYVVVCMTAAETARHLGVSYWTARHLLHEAGVMRPRYTQPRKG